jgi:excisionase family DNA binding protein
MSALIIIPPEELRALLVEVVREEVRAALADARATNSEEDGYLSVQKAAALADVHPDTIRAWIKAGRLRGYRAGRELRVLRSELCHFLEAGDSADHRETPEEEAATILARRRSG